MSLPPDFPGGALDRLLDGLEHTGMKLGLERIAALLAAAGHPERSFRAVLVGGTNGKGSTSSLLASIVRAAGYRTGHFVSPHLESIRERIRVDGRAIEEGALRDQLAAWLQIADHAGLAPPTYFEALTLAAFGHFRDSQVDLAVLEVGLGGRLDATNTCDPMLSVITAISFDHQAQLGHTLTAITREKAAIARPGRPLVAWTAPPEVADALRQYAAGAELISAPDLAKVDENGDGSLRVETPAAVHHLEQALSGRHQRSNLALAVLAAERLGETLPRIDAAAIRQGVAACRWPGRLERVTLPDGRSVLLDAAHNPAGVAALCDHLDQEGGGFDLLFGALADKAIDEMLPPLAERARSITLTRPPSPRAQDPRTWLPLCGGREKAVVDEPAAALDRALGNLPLGGTLVICGSIYLLGELRPRLRAKFGVPPPTV